MRRAIQNRPFISQYIKLDFSNQDNLKQDIQNRQTVNIEMVFLKSLQNIQGDNKANEGENFSEITRLAMAYFYECIFPKYTSIKDSYYTINSIKGFFDTCNYTPYTVTYEVDTTYYKLKNTLLFNACYLILQSAWYFNSKYFGSHQYLDYSSHYIKTGSQLPIEDYQYEKGDLLRKYDKIDKERHTKYGFKGEPAYKFVEQWYYCILYMVCKELAVPTHHFKVTSKDFRIYNPLTKCPRILRAETPFKIIECDIKSAFPSFLDLQTGSSIKEQVYSTLMSKRNITRSEAKVLFNSKLNSGNFKTPDQIKLFLIECGYSYSQAEEITTYTNGKKKFIVHMSEFEEAAINDFININSLHNAIRLHDSVFFFYTGKKKLILEAEDGCIKFGRSVLKQPVYNNNFSYSSKKLPFAHVSSIPPATDEEYKNLVRKKILTYPKVKGDSNGFRFYESDYEYISASFDVNQKYEFDDFMTNCKQMIYTLNYLNNKAIANNVLYMILLHIRQNSNTIFNMRFMFRELLKHSHCIKDIEIRKRDFKLLENLTFRKKIDFLKALNGARGKVNIVAHYKTILKHLLEDINKPKNDWIKFGLPRNKRKHTASVHIIANRINYLRTGKRKAFDVHIQSCQPLYSSLYQKSGVSRIEHHKKSNQFRLVQRKIEKYERELNGFIVLQSNRNIAKQYVHILSDFLGITLNCNILRDEVVIYKEKEFLQKEIGKEKLPIELNSEIKKKPLSIIPTIEDFDTSLEHSAFNIDIEEAYSRGDLFFYEYIKFHKLHNVEKEIKKIKKPQYHLPELEFEE